MSRRKVLATLGALGVTIISCFLAGCHHASQVDAASTARLKWKFNTDHNNAIGSVVLGRDGTIYAGALDGIYAIAPDGTERWKQPMAGPGNLAVAEDGMLYSASVHGLVTGYLPNGALSWDPRQGLIGFGAPPAIGRNGWVLVSNSASDLFAFRPEGSQQPAWSRMTERPGLSQTDSSLPGTGYSSAPQSRNAPAVWRDDTIALPRQHWIHLFGFNGSLEWTSQPTDGQLGPAALADDGTVYVADDRGKFYAVNRGGGVAWFALLDGPLLGSAVVGADNTVYFATPRSVSALAMDGSLKWQTKIPFPGTTGLALAQDGSIYGAGSGGIYALRPDGSVKWTLRTMAGTGAPSIASDGTIYFPCGYMWLCAVEDQGSPLAQAPWPKMYHDAENTSRISTAF